MMVNSSSSSLFTCEHVKTIEAAVQPEKRYFDLPDLQGYKCGDTVRSDLLRLGELSGNLPLAVKVSPLMFCVFGHVSSNNPAGYCHVKVQEDALKCYSKDCKTFVAKAKQNKAKNICMHVHVLISLGIISNETFEKTKSITASASRSAMESTSPAPESASASGSMESISSSRVSASACGSMESTPSGLHSASASGSMESTSSSAESGPWPISTSSTDNSLDTVSRVSTVQLNMKRSLPLQIPSAVIGQAHSMDIKGWPPSLSPSCFSCGLCNGPLSEAKSHPGQRGDAIVLTNLNPFRKIKLFVKFCQSKSCQAMHQVFPYDLGKVFLLNLTFFLHIPQHKYSVVLIRLLISFLFFGGCRSVTIGRNIVLQLHIYMQIIRVQEDFYRYNSIILK